jgi:hypothetical protein
VYPMVARGGRVRRRREGRARGEQAASDAEDEREESTSNREDECWEKEEKGGIRPHATGSARESVRFFSMLALSLFRFQGSGIMRR